MFKAKVFVSLKQSVLDPQGQVITNALHSQGYTSVVETRVSKYFEIMIDTNDKQKAEADLKSICDKVLANPNTESWKYELEGV
ncbi:MAG TPA: phosphoribosylformylglycinamidine synthase subunit PurS [Candidatus Cloacimonadota bacterium]|jgi:phosphoribosylformylglycinamidine synthase|nr:phosphoribosylformylglycinamidine synthase subunit PurS [Candidatus Cloacimonadales bacterium]HOE90773.1 phosphoribosylformylglycinamidine synthase subunit PurS [Candidatus Cloacimonadota bacterium]HOQ80692.1 phosphoribosylformylglycinamidine synthase subunit PurS [Candidatus Cloacimonadota bacterium]HPK41105.1 phosphoribosylformylglycinamidine synthase subunit PurS [Candidatus Cloacimonadota bacterium]HPY95848.1 phosphoribosylformylglycinamidine synthase subunit PurS [Candidatus Cloacimonad